MEECDGFIFQAFFVNHGLDTVKQYTYYIITLIQEVKYEYKIKMYAELIITFPRKEGIKLPRGNMSNHIKRTTKYTGFS